MIASDIGTSLRTSNSLGARSGSSTGSSSAISPAEKVLDRRRRIVSFAPGSIFAFVRWASNDYGTVISRVDIVRSVAPGEAFSTLPFVRPGGDILLAHHRLAQGRTGAAGDRRHGGCRHRSRRRCARPLATCPQPSDRGRGARDVYTPARHSAWLLRQRTEA